MAFVPGFKSRLLLGDFNLAAYTREVTAPWSQDMLDTTVLTDGGAKTFIPGQDTSTLTVSGLYDAAEHADLAAAKSATAQPITFGPSGLALGAELWMVNALEMNIEMSAQPSGVSEFSMAAQTDGPSDMGVSLHDLLAVTADESGTAYDGSAASSGGGVAQLHVTAFSGFSGAVVIVEDSANGSTGWATIATFTTVAAATAERVAAAGAVRRYLRYSVDVTGSGSITFQVGFARR